MPRRQCFGLLLGSSAPSPSRRPAPRRRDGAVPGRALHSRKLACRACSIAYASPPSALRDGFCRTVGLGARLRLLLRARSYSPAPCRVARLLLRLSRASAAASASRSFEDYRRLVTSRLSSSLPRAPPLRCARVEAALRHCARVRFALIRSSHASFARPPPRGVQVPRPRQPIASARYVPAASLRFGCDTFSALRARTLSASPRSATRFPSAPSSSARTVQPLRFLFYLRPSPRRARRFGFAIARRERPVGARCRLRASRAPPPGLRLCLALWPPL